MRCLPSIKSRSVCSFGACVIAKRLLIIVSYGQLHPFCQQKAIVQYCREHAVVVQAYCPILRGKMDDVVITEIAQKVTERSTRPCYDPIDNLLHIH